MAYENKTYNKMPPSYLDGAVPTLNDMGAMDANLSDPITMGFIDYAKNLIKGNKVLEVGSAYGNLVLELLKKTQVSVTANDLDARHLNILYQRALQCCSKDIERLTLSSGNFANETTLKANSYNGVMLHSVLLFMTPEEVEKSLEKTNELLKEQGKLFIFARSPYAYKRFIPEYEKRLKSGEKWPGFVKDMSLYSKTITNRPLFLLDKAALRQILESKAFIVQDIFAMKWNKKSNKWVKEEKGDFTGVVAIKK